MNEYQDANSSNSISSGSESEIRKQVATLAKLLSAMLLVLIVLGGSLNLYLLRQWLTASKETTALRKNLNERQQNYNTEVPKILGPLQQYAKTHPDYAKILEKYPVAGMTSSTVPTRPDQL